MAKIFEYEIDAEEGIFKILKQNNNAICERLGVRNITGINASDACTNIFSKTRVSIRSAACPDILTGIIFIKGTDNFNNSASSLCIRNAHIEALKMFADAVNGKAVKARIKL